MPKIINSERIPIHLWLDQLDEDTLQQAKNLANLPFAFHHIAIMPDAHFGYGMPIGGILAADGAIIPNAVGVDIGCGMCAVKTSLQTLERNELKSVMKSIRQTIPLGFKHHREPLPHKAMPDRSEVDELKGQTVIESEYDNARTQVGTLGGGNHFIEFQQGSDGRIWFMIHSGSRNLGFKVAGYYNKKAIEMNKKWHTPFPPSWQLSYLPADSPEGHHYLTEMSYCVRFAERNRLLMSSRVAEALLENVSPDVSFEDPINIAHNYAALEIHYGKKVFIHRKGATSARQGQTGIIPGSQGSLSYIVSGKGAPESFSSCSHGAGRRLGRKQAQKQLNLEKERQLLESKGIIHALRSKRDLEEAAGAYKDIADVMAKQADLIEIKETLSPLAVIKG